MPKDCRNVDEMINKYLDGELSEPHRMRFEEMLRSDPSLKTRLDCRKRILRCLRAFRKIKFPASGLRQARAAIMRRVSAA